jgi:hypothetical protein
VQSTQVCGLQRCGRVFFDGKESDSRKIEFRIQGRGAQCSTRLKEIEILHPTLQNTLVLGGGAYFFHHGLQRGACGGAVARSKIQNY